MWIEVFNFLGYRERERIQCSRFQTFFLDIIDAMVAPPVKRQSSSIVLLFSHMVIDVSCSWRSMEVCEEFMMTNLNSWIWLNFWSSIIPSPQSTLPCSDAETLPMFQKSTPNRIGHGWRTTTQYLMSNQNCCCEWCGSWIERISPCVHNLEITHPVAGNFSLHRLLWHRIEWDWSCTQSACLLVFMRAHNTLNSLRRFSPIVSSPSSCTSWTNIKNRVSSQSVQNLLWFQIFRISDIIQWFAWLACMLQEQNALFDRGEVHRVLT